MQKRHATTLLTLIGTYGLVLTATNRCGFSVVKREIGIVSEPGIYRIYLPLARKSES